MKVINQNSLLLVALILLLLICFLPILTETKTTTFMALVLVTIGLAATWFILFRPTQTEVEDASVIQSIIGGGVPVLLEFQSPY